MKTILKLAVLSLALAACGHKGSDTSAAKDLIGPGQGGYQGTEKVTFFVPSGLATTGMVALTQPIQSTSLEIHSSCTIQLQSMMASYDYGAIGALQQSSYSANIWQAPSGKSRLWTGLQLTVQNYGAPTYCQISVKSGDPMPAIDPVYTGSEDSAQ